MAASDISPGDEPSSDCNQPAGVAKTRPAGERARSLISGRKRHIVAGTVAGIVGFAMLTVESGPTRATAMAGPTTTHSLTLPPPRIPALAESAAAETSLPEPAPEWIEKTVARGQTLAHVFTEVGLSAGDVHRVVHVDDRTRRLTRLYPGDRLMFQLGEEGDFRAMEYQLDETNRLRVTAGPEGLSSTLIKTDVQVQVQQASGVIRQSLFLAGRRAGLSDVLILELARLFGWDIDFILDIRAGDSFHVLYEEIYRDGERLRTGDILAATFINQGRKYQAIRFESEDGVGYYSPDGRNMKKAFLRAPLNFSRVSSNFNPRRLHPVLKQVRPHNGIDYAAPSGTPVYAAGDGRVTRAGYTAPNGHHVFIKHPNGVVTKYLHFTRSAVNKGQRVSQGQVIGYVGATGLATAPHLHYEFIVNGVHRNPATVQLPKADPLGPEQLARFEAVAKPWLSQLDRLQADTMIATAE